MNYNQIIQHLLDENKRINTISYLKSTQFEEDEINGLKLFLEKNNWDISKLRKSTTPPSFENMFKSKDKPSQNIGYLKYAAVLILLFAVVGFSFWYTTDTSSTLYSKYYQKDVGLPVTMGHTDRILFAKSMNAYKDDDYQSSSKGFQALLNSKPENDTLNYYLGCTYMEMNQVDKSISSLKKVDKKSVFKEKSEFRLALLYLKENRIKMSKEILTQIVENKNHQYYSEARQLLKETPFN